MRVTGTIYGNVPLNDLTDADDLKAIEGLSGTSGWLKKTAANTWALGTLAASDIPNIDAGKITSGTLPIARGGTGLTASPSMLTNLGSTTAANVLQTSPRPGITGTLGAANGGTGKTTLKDSANALINALDTGSSNLTSNDYVITQYVGGGTTTTTYHRRPASALRVGGLLTARKLTIGSTGKNFDGTADVSWTLAEIGAATSSHTHSRSDIGLSTDNNSGTLDSITRVNIGSTASNKTFHLPANAIIIEYSTDNGATWLDYGATDEQKISLFSETRTTSFNLGKATAKANNKVANQLRVTIEPTDRYCSLDAVYVWMNTQGNTVVMDLERSTIGAKDTFTSVFTNQPISGWFGNNIRYFPNGTFGGGSIHTTNNYKYRLTFRQTAVNTNYPSAFIQDIRFLGWDVWTPPNNMVKLNHLYSWDNSLNATFPAELTATKFKGNLDWSYIQNKPTILSIGTGSGNAAAGNHNHDNVYVNVSGDTMTGTLQIKNPSDKSSIAYSGGGFHAGYVNLVLHGGETGSSGIVFCSNKGDTNINSPSDRGFIQFHSYGITTATAEGTAPTLATSGEKNRLVIGVGNDADDQLWLQTPSVNGLIHQTGAISYVIPSLSATTTAANHPLISTTTAGLYANNTNVTINGGTITAATFSGNATSATGFATAKKIALTGNVTGEITGGNGSNGWSIPTTIGEGVVTNNMLAGSIANGKLANSKVTIAGNDVSLGDSLDTAILKTSLGLSSAMHYIGKATVTITDGSTTDPKIGGSATTLVSGDVVIDSSDSREYVWNGSKWELLGGDSSYKVTQTAVTDAAYSGSDTATTFVSAVTQNANGVITVTKRKLPTYNNYSHPTTSGNKHIPSGGSSGQFLGWSADGTAKWVANPNTDKAVLQTSTNSNHWRKVLVGYQYDANPNVAVTNQTNQVYASPNLEFKSQSGTLKATEYSVNGNVTLQYNSTTESLDFVF